MRYTTILIASLLILTIVFSCKKNNNSNTNCFPYGSTIRQITNAQATVIKEGEKFYIIEQGTIDTKLNPCALSQEFQVDHLPVTISGEVKSTVRGKAEPCCTENFEITKISK